MTFALVLEEPDILYLAYPGQCFFDVHNLLGHHLATVQSHVFPVGIIDEHCSEFLPDNVHTSEVGTTSLSCDQGELSIKDDSSFIRRTKPVQVALSEVCKDAGKVRSSEYLSTKHSFLSRDLHDPSEAASDSEINLIFALA